jgi:hypothetical protein
MFDEFSPHFEIMSFAKAGRSCLFSSRGAPSDRPSRGPAGVLFFRKLRLGIMISESEFFGQ